MTNLVEIRGLKVEATTDSGRRIQIIRGVDIDIADGEIVALIGESGSGKTTIALTLMGYARPGCRISGGSVTVAGRDMVQLSEMERAKIRGTKISYVPQSAAAAFNPAQKIIDQVIEVTRIHDLMPPQEARQRAVELFKALSLPNPETIGDRYPHQVSGGQLQRLSAAMALIGNPDLVIFDEPTTALDVTVQAEVLALLKELQRETGMAVLIITHDLGVVAEIADRVVVMEKGVLVEAGTVREVYRNPKHPYTRKLISAAPGRGEMHEPNATGEPLLRVRDVRKRYGAFEALKGVSFDLMAGETIAVVGESGSGKSTLARILLRLDEPDAGSAEWKGRDLFKLSPAELFALRRDLQMVFQDPTQSLNPRMTVFQLVSEAWVIHPDILPKAKWRERVAELLHQVGLSPEHMRRYPHQFSGGQRQRIAIARALALEPKLIICDEAVSALDVSVQAQVVALLDKLRREMGLSFIFIAHDLPVVRDFADHVMVMQRGEVVEFGTVRQVFEAPREAYTRALLSASLDPDPDMQSVRPADADHTIGNPSGVLS